MIFSDIIKSIIVLNMDKYEIRFIKDEEWADAMDLVYHTFLQFDAPMFTESGIAHFRNFIMDPALKQMYATGSFQMVGAFEGNRIIGVVALRNDHHISLLFVEEGYQKQGVGRKLVRVIAEYSRDKLHQEYMTVNSSPYAVDFYHRLGFEDISEEVLEDGIFYTPMKWKLIC